MNTPRLTTLLMLLAAACGGPIEDFDEREEAVFLGTTDTVTTAVVRLGNGCSATFISPTFVMTAAHCLPRCPRPTGEACYDPGTTDAWHVNSRSGTYTNILRGGTLGGTGSTHRIDYAWVVPADTTAWPYGTPDVAILRVDGRDAFQGPVMPLMPPGRLPDASTLSQYAGQTAYFTGYSPNVNQTSMRRTGSGSIGGTSQRGRQFRVDGSQTGQSGCGGDSGGAVYMIDATGKKELIGVISQVPPCGGVSRFVDAAFIPSGFFESILAEESCHARTDRASHPNRTVPDASPAGIAQTINVGDVGIVSDANVIVDIDHDYRGDLRVVLEHAGRTHVLHDRAGGSLDDLNIDSAVATFIGTDAQGAWTLRVFDLASGDVGRLVRFRVELLTGPSLHHSGARRSAGFSWDHDAVDDSRPFSRPLPLVGLGIAKSNDRVYAWYSDRTTSAGHSNDLDAYIARRPFVAPRYDIVAMAIGLNDRIHTWYANGTYSVGYSTSLAHYQAPAPFTLPPGKTPADIVDAGISSSGAVYTWFTDGQVSIGTPSDLDAIHAPYAYSTMCNQTVMDLEAMGIAGSNDRVYAFSRFQVL